LPRTTFEINRSLTLRSPGGRLSLVNAVTAGTASPSPGGYRASWRVRQCHRRAVALGSPTTSSLLVMQAPLLPSTAGAFVRLSWLVGAGLVGDSGECSRHRWGLETRWRGEAVDGGPIKE
jgi:hypothetical protein